MTLRRLPADFLVREVLVESVQSGLRAEPGREARFAIYSLSKTSRTTPEATGALAGALGVKHAMLSHAGLKDKHAQTQQHVSVEAKDAESAAKLPEKAAGAGWTAERLGWWTSALDASAIAVNEFSLIVRGLAREECKQMDKRAALLHDGATGGLWITNYFGDQRFGSARHGEGFAGRMLIKGDFEGALKLLIGTPARKDTGARRELTRLLIAQWGQWKAVLRECPKCAEREAVEVLARGGTFREAFAALPEIVQQMSVEAYQSHLWNAAARRQVELIAKKAPAEVFKADDEFGEMVFMPAKALSPEWRGVQMPMLAPGVSLDPRWAAAVTATLKDENIRLDELAIPGLKRPSFGTAMRPLFAMAGEFRLSEARRDELAPEKSSKPWKRLAEFPLPRGAYATVVMRALGQ